MATFKQLAYAILDFSKTISDDSIINIEHIKFLMSKYRNTVLLSTYGQRKTVVPEGNYQTICVDLEEHRAMADMMLCGEDYMKRSKKSLPIMLPIGYTNIYYPAGFNYGNLQLVNNIKFKYAGFSRFLKVFGYSTIGPDQYLYIKYSKRSEFNPLKVILTGVFEDIDKAAKMECSNSGCCDDSCSSEDKRFPIDDALLPNVVKLVVQDIVGASWRPKDDTNNAKDDMAIFAKILNQYTTQSFKNQMNGNSKR